MLQLGHSGEVVLSAKQVKGTSPDWDRIAVNLKVNRGSVKNPDGRRIFLPNEGFKGILAVPAGAAAAISARGRNGEAVVQGTIWHFLCRDNPSQQFAFEPNASSLRQTLRADR
jgi:hypothetical protein